MLFMPLNFLIMWLGGLLSIGILGGGLYIIYEWYERELVELSYLVTGIAMVLWSFAGRFLSLPLLRRPGTDEPEFMRTGTVQHVNRPDGSVLQVEFYGPTDGSLYINVELSGFTGTETRGQLKFSALLSALGWPAVLARGTLAMLDYDETRTLSAVDVPVLVVVGASDIATIPAASIHMKAQFPSSELVTLKPGGHMSLMEQNQHFAEAVSSFIAVCFK